MIFPDVDKIFLEEIQNHNDIVGVSSELQNILTVAITFGVNITDIIHDVLDFMQRKEYDNVVKILSDAVYSIDQLARELDKVSAIIRSGVLKSYEQKDIGNEEHI